MISTISQHKINTNCLNQYNKNFKKLKTNIFKSILISLVFGKTLILGKSMEPLSASAPLALPKGKVSANQEKYKPFTPFTKRANKKFPFKGKSNSAEQLPLIRQKIRGQVFFSPALKIKEHSLWKKLENDNGAKTPQHFSNNIWGLLLFSREDLAFINLRGLLSTLLKALQVCLFALLNNKRIIFVGDAQPLVEEHHQRLLSCFIANQAKAFSTTIALKLPPFLPSLPIEPEASIGSTSQTLTKVKAKERRSLNYKLFLPKSGELSSQTVPLSFPPTVENTGFGPSNNQNKYLQEVKNSLFGNLHVLINTKITKPKELRAYEYAPAISSQPGASTSTNVLSTVQSTVVRSAKARIELPVPNKQELNSKIISRTPLTTQKIKTKTIAEKFPPMEQPIGQKYPDLTLANANAELSLKEKLYINQNLTPVLQEKVTTGNKNSKTSNQEPNLRTTITLSQQSKEYLYSGKPANSSSPFLQSKQKLKWMGFQTNKPLYFESTKMEEGFCLKKDFKLNIVPNTINLRQRLGLSSTKFNNKTVSKIIEKSVPFNTSPRLLNHHTNFSTYDNSTFNLKGSFIESQPLVNTDDAKCEAKDLSGKVATAALAVKMNGQDSVVAAKPNIDSNFPVTDANFYTEMAKLISKAAIRNSQWTATLAQPTNYWIGGFFSNSSATYKQNLSSTTLLNIKMDPQSQLQQFRDLYAKSKSTSLEVYKGNMASEKALFDLKRSESILIAALAKNKADEKRLPRKEGKPLTKVKTKGQTHFKNSVGKISVKKSKVDVLVKARPSKFSNKEEKRLFFEKSLFSVTSTLPLGDRAKLSTTHRRPEGNGTLKGTLHLLDSIGEFSGGLWGAIYAPVARKNLANKSEVQEFYTQRKPITKSFRGRIPAKIKILKRQKGRKDLKGIHKRIIDHCLNSIEVNKARNAWLSEADLVFFANPEKNLSLLNQINRLKIPTIGIINSGSDLAFPFRSVKGPSLLSAKQTITYPIIGNSNSLNFLRIVLTKFACVLSLKRN